MTRGRVMQGSAAGEPAGACERQAAQPDRDEEASTAFGAAAAASEPGGANSMVNTRAAKTTGSCKRRAIMLHLFGADSPWARLAFVPRRSHGASIAARGY